MTRHARGPARPFVLAVLVALRFTALRAQDATELRKDAGRTFTFAADFSYQSFRGDIDPWRVAYLSLGKRTSKGSLIARVNYASRFGATGAQVEIDAYPRLSANSYAYLNVGYSAADIFPAWRSGAEVYASLPRAWEASLGYRQLRFGGVPVTLFTGTAGKYVGNYWFSLRPFVHQKDNGTSASVSLMVRRYGADADHYRGMRVGYGSAPPDQVIPDAAALTRTHAFSASLQGSGDLRGGLLGLWSAGYDAEQLDSGIMRKSWTLAAGLKLLF